MKYYFEWSAQKDIDVRPGNYFESMVMTKENIYMAAAGHDEFQLAGMVMPGKRFAGFGRSRFYQLREGHADAEAIEAAPSAWVDIGDDITEMAFKINTDIILDPGLLASCLSLGIAKEGGLVTNIPLNRPDIRIDWQSRGTFIVTVSAI